MTIEYEIDRDIKYKYNTTNTPVFNYSSYPLTLFLLNIADCHYQRDIKLSKIALLSIIYIAVFKIVCILFTKVGLIKIQFDYLFIKPIIIIAFLLIFIKN